MSIVYKHMDKKNCSLESSESTGLLRPFFELDISSSTLFPRLEPKGIGMSLQTRLMNEC